jgi:DNA-binding phage protein
MAKKMPIFSLKSMPICKSKKASYLLSHVPSAFFTSKKKVALALLASLEEGDSEAFLEILNVYLSANRTRVSKETKLSRTTVQNAFSKKGTPTIRTLAKIVSQSVSEFLTLNFFSLHIMYNFSTPSCLLFAACFA